MTIIENRTIDFTLKHGAHQPNDNGEACLLEAVAWLAGEEWTDQPECCCPVLAAFGRSWNDALPDDKRTELLAPFAERLVGTRSTPEVQDARAFMASDWAVRTYSPVWLRVAGLDDAAVALESLPEMTSAELCRTAMPIISDARNQAAAARDAARAAAWDAAGAAAGAAARAAAGAAAWAAARAAAWDAAWGAAGDAAGDAARAAAGDAAGDAAGAAAWDVLRPHVETLQTSAVDLFDRMINLTEVTQ